MKLSLNKSDSTTAKFKEPSFDPARPFERDTPSDQMLGNLLLDPGLGLLGTTLNPQQQKLYATQVGASGLLRQQQYLIFDVANNIGVLSPQVDRVSKALQLVSVVLDSTKQKKVAEEMIINAVAIAGQGLSAIPNIYTQIAGTLLQVGAWVAARYGTYHADLPVSEPSQHYSKGTDESQYNTRVRPIMQFTRDWTSLFKPRFKGRLSMDVQQDAYGRKVFSFFHGNGHIARISGVNSNDQFNIVGEGEFSEPPGEGLGMAPGTERIFSVLQVTSLESPHGDALRVDKTIYGHRCGDGLVSSVDVGNWYPVTSQGVMSLWNFMWEKGPAMFSINCRAARNAWAYSMSEVIGGVRQVWDEAAWMGAKDRFGWGCGFWEECLSAVVGNYCMGVRGDIGGAMSSAGVTSALQSHGAGSIEAHRAWEKANMYHRVIKPSLDRLREAQLWYLENTVMAAYLPVRGGVDSDPVEGQGEKGPMGALRDPDVREAFIAARKRILNGSERYEVRLRDVVSKTFRNEIKAAGGGTDSMKPRFTIGLDPPKPFAPVGGAGIIPPVPRDRARESEGGALLVAAGVGAGVATAGLAYYWDDIIRKIRRR